MTDIAVNSRLLGLKNINVHVEDHGGEGRPVVLIHGWPLSGASWSEQIVALKSAGYRVIAYDRRGFGQSDKPSTGYDYETFADDLNGLLEELDLHEITLIGFSMGGGEVARYISKYGEARLHSAVLASAVPPYLMHSSDNPDGPLTEDAIKGMSDALSADEDAFYDDFLEKFFSANGDGNVLISDEQLAGARALCRQADKTAALGSMKAFGTTDFRSDLPLITIPTLVIHGDSDVIVPFDGSGKRSHEAIQNSELHVIAGGPHGINVSHTAEFNSALLGFLAK